MAIVLWLNITDTFVRAQVSFPSKQGNHVSPVLTEHFLDTVAQIQSVPREQLAKSDLMARCEIKWCMICNPSLVKHAHSLPDGQAQRYLFVLILF